MARFVHLPPSTPTPRFPFYDFYAKPDTPNGESTKLTFNHFLYSMDDHDMEYDHDYVQWVFPNPHPSQQRPDTAQFECTEKEYQRFMADPIVMTRVEAAITKMLKFWGITYNRHTHLLVIHQKDSKLFCEKLIRTDHNQSRFTRLLTFLRCIHREAFAQSLVYLFYDPWVPRYKINDRSWRIWHSAARLQL